MKLLLVVSATGKGANTVFSEPQGGHVYNTDNTTAWNQVSDERIKKNIVDNKTGLEFINKVKIRNL
jgi:hypothetical protein